MNNAFRETSIHILRMFVEDRGLVAERMFCDVQRVIDDVRNVLSPADEQIGVWESVELNAADRALATGFPQLALIFTAKALAVFQLSPEEYKYGLDLLRHESDASAKREGAQGKASRPAREAESANVEKAVAEVLEGAQAKAAQDLARFQQSAALALRLEQDEAALNLAEENARAAAHLVAEGEIEMHKFIANEQERDAYQTALEQIISWASGSYSISSSRPSAASFCEKIYRDRCAAAECLKAHQQKVAETLRESQRKRAKKLEHLLKAESDYLKESQRLDAIELADRQIVKGLRKKILEDQVVRAPRGLSRVQRVTLRIPYVTRHNSVSFPNAD